MKQSILDCVCGYVVIEIKIWIVVKCSNTYIIIVIHGALFCNVICINLHHLMFIDMAKLNRNN